MISIAWFPFHVVLLEAGFIEGVTRGPLSEVVPVGPWEQVHQEIIILQIIM